jgi:hypothetical protein
MTTLLLAPLLALCLAAGFLSPQLVFARLQNGIRSEYRALAGEISSLGQIPTSRAKGAREMGHPGFIIRYPGFVSDFFHFTWENL